MSLDEINTLTICVLAIGLIVQAATIRRMQRNQHNLLIAMASLERKLKKIPGEEEGNHDAVSHASED